MAVKKIFELALVLSATDKASKTIADSVAKSKKAIDSMNDAGDKAFDFGKKAGAAGLGLTAILAAPLKAAADIESMNVALRTSFQGNEAAARDAFNKINKFAADTPYELEEVMTSFIKLKNMGLDPSEEALSAYGNTASSMGKSLNDMIEAVADAATGEFERLKEFGIKAKSEGDKVTFTFQGVATTVGKNSKEIEQYLKYIGSVKFAGGIEAQSKTAKGMLSTLKDGIVMTAAKIGTAMLPKAKELITDVSKIVDKVAAWVAKNPALTMTILKIIAGLAVLSFSIAGISFVLGGLFKTIAIVRQGMLLYQTVVMGVTAVQNVMAMSALAGSSALTTLSAVLKALNLGFLTSPIFWVVLAIAAAAFLIIKYWEPIKAFFAKLWEWIKVAFSKFLSFVKKWGVLLLGPIGLVIKYWDNIKGFFIKLWVNVKDIFWKGLAFFMGLPKMFMKLGIDIISGLWEGIKSKAASLFNFVKDVGKNIAKAFKTVLGIASPSKVFMDYGVNITEGAKKGIEKGSPGAVGASSGMGKSLTPSSGKSAGGIGGGITVNFSPVISGGGSSTDIAAEIKKIIPQLVREIQSVMERKQRLSY